MGAVELIENSGADAPDAATGSVEIREHIVSGKLSKQKPRPY